MGTKSIPEPVSRLIEAFSSLPSVGSKTAARLTYYLLSAPDLVAVNLAEAIQSIKADVHICSVCFNITVDDPCPICSDSHRDQRLVAVVALPLDTLAIERTDSFNGVYHVLHGLISPVNGIGPDDLRIRELVARVEQGTILEVIMATNPGLEGDATTMVIQRELAATGVKITRLARGLPIGGDIEYADTITLSRALQGRNEV